MFQQFCTIKGHDMCQILEICVELDCKEQTRRLCYLCQKMRHHDSHQTIMEIKFKEFLDGKRQKLVNWDQIDLAQNFKQFKLNIQHKIDIINIWLDCVEQQFYLYLTKLEESWGHTKDLLDQSFFSIGENNIKELLNIDYQWGQENVAQLRKMVIQILKDLEQKIKIEQVENPFQNIPTIQQEQFVRVIHNEIITKDRVFQIYFQGQQILDTKVKRWVYELDGQELGGGEYVKGKREGLWIIPILGENSRNNPFLKFQNIYFKDGLEHGIYRVTSIDQKIIEEGNYDKGLRVGPWKEVCESKQNQTVIFRGSYQGGLKNGEWNYMKGNNILGGGFYKDGKKDGRWKEPDLLSLIVYHVGDYKDDIKVGEWIIWKQNSAIRKYNQ
ncbi:hypothetical protein pb186bvf_002911 [Paramecium bursaria]